MEPILLNGVWQAATDATGEIQSTNPATKEKLPESYPISSFIDLEKMLIAAHEAVVELRTTPKDKIANFLDAYADAIESRKDSLVETAHIETALPAGTRLPGELGRTTGQLRQAAAAVREGSWVHATIDTASNIRAMFGSLAGPVAVFGPNNFPLAFNGVSGGDFAAAIAAGNPVIAKANPGHLKTTKILAEAALEAIHTSGVPKAMVQMFYHTENKNGLKLVAHPLIGATAFTGSKAGLHLKKAADLAGKPIYLEMSSVNPVYILPNVLEERFDSVVGELYASCTMGTGQFCTNPGLVFVLNNDKSHAFIDTVKTQFESTEPGILLTERGTDVLEHGIAVWAENGAQQITGGMIAGGDGYRFQNTLYIATGEQFLNNPGALQTEAFGVASLIVLAEDEDQLLAMTTHLEGNLTGSIYSDSNGSDDALYDRIAPVLREKVGRLINDKMPTGVAVVPSMNHGGPFPSTGHPGFTAVGIPASMTRFAALHSYDNVRPHRLPPELRDEAPNMDMWRLVDGNWMQGNI